jgi:hypothetical protein
MLFVAELRFLSPNEVEMRTIIEMPPNTKTRKSTRAGLRLHQHHLAVVSPTGTSLNPVFPNFFLHSAISPENGVYDRTNIALYCSVKYIIRVLQQESVIRMSHSEFLEWANVEQFDLHFSTSPQNLKQCLNAVDTHI